MNAEDMVQLLLINTFWLTFAPVASRLHVGVHSHFLKVWQHIPASLALNRCTMCPSEVLPVEMDLSDISNGTHEDGNHLL